MSESHNENAAPIISEHYRIEKCLGEGGSCLVYAAHDTKLNRRVALRVLKPGLADVPTARERFLNESRAGCVIEHPNVLPIFEVQESGPHPFAVLPHTDGESLQQCLERGALSFEQIRPMALEMAKGIEAIHEAGFVHGDLKPGNVLCGARTQLTDFGASFKNTITLAYQAPEQIDGAAAGVKSDLYALGVVLYEMTTGSLPYQARQSAALAKAIAMDPVPRLPAGSATRSFRDLVGCLLAKDPNERPANASEVVEILSRVEKKPPRRFHLLLWMGLSALASLAVMGALEWHRPNIPSDTSIYVSGESARFENLQEAIERAGPGATIVIRDGVHELPKRTVIRDPLVLRAAEGALPVVRRPATAGEDTLFEAKAALELEGLTLTSRTGLSDDSSPLVLVDAPTTISHCRLEQEPAWPMEKLPTLLAASHSLSLIRTEIDAPYSFAITFEAPEDSSKAAIRLDECALAVAHGIGLNASPVGHATEIDFRRTNVLAGRLFQMAQAFRGVPHWQLRGCALDVDQMLVVVKPWREFQKDNLADATWRGQHNCYSVVSFLRAGGIGAPVPDSQRSVAGWLSICPGATEEAFYDAPETIILSRMPKNHRNMPRWLRNQKKPFTAIDLRVRNEDTLRHHPDAGGDMSRVGPSARL